jgi:hypothetical protein
MKRVVMLGLLVTVFSLVLVSAETWEQFIQRAETMTYNASEGINRGNQNTWNIDKWGALMATYDWLMLAYEDIYKNAPNLTSYERETYRNIYRRRFEMFNDLKELCSIVYGRDTNTIRRITDRMAYWWDYLHDGGLITFN